MTSANKSNLQYAGDVPPRAAWQALLDDANALLIDVRTPEEWAFVGIVDTTPLGRDCIFIPWALYPRMDLNPDFCAQLEVRAKPTPETPLYFLCRSGQRSAYAAHAMTQLGYTRCYNIAEGFEGDRNEDKRRASKNGWKVADLPWIQN